MCIAIPMQVIETADGWAWCDDGGDDSQRQQVDLRLVGEQPPGTWLLVFLGAARDVIDEQRAMHIRDALTALDAVQQGESVEHLFADLIGREPELPAFLRQNTAASAEVPDQQAARVDLHNDHPLDDRHPLPAGAVGPGSQPDEPDAERLDYLPMPERMQTYRQPLLPEPEEIVGLDQGLRLLDALQDALADDRIGTTSQILDLSVLDQANLRLLENSLGEGEVSILQLGAHDRLQSDIIQHPVQNLLHNATSTLARNTGGTAAQETRLAGVWRVRETDAAGNVLRDVLEVGNIPGFVRDMAFDGASKTLDLADLASKPLPDAVMNAPGVLAELNQQVVLRQHNSDAPKHIVNLSLLPLGEGDLAFLSEHLGTGWIDIVSRGYGNCRMTATAVQNLWWVQFFNSDDRLILNTLEVTDVPEAALAAAEDLQDSALRLSDIRQALR